MRHLVAAILALFATAASANDKELMLYVPDELVSTGLMKHILPRFALKTQIRVKLVDTPDAAEATLGAEGAPVIARGSKIWHLSDNGGPDAERFADWIGKSVGHSAITGFVPASGAGFTIPETLGTQVETVIYEGDAALGLRISKAKCGRCHSVDHEKMNTIGSAPSFAAMRTFEDWGARFAGFYALRPHPPFTQIADVTDPFPEDRPSPIVPIEMTLDEIEAMLAYVQQVEPADLGAPIEHQ